MRKRIEAGKDFIYCVKCDERVPFKDHIEECLGSDRVARKVVTMDERATQELDAQALEQILIGHMQAICGEANQIFRELPESATASTARSNSRTKAASPAERRFTCNSKAARLTYANAKATAKRCSM